jgi:hypothetical protein
MCFPNLIHALEFPKTPPHDDEASWCCFCFVGPFHAEDMESKACSEDCSLRRQARMFEICMRHRYTLGIVEQLLHIERRTSIRSWWWFSGISHIIRVLATNHLVRSTRGASYEITMWSCSLRAWKLMGSSVSVDERLR